MRHERTVHVIDRDPAVRRSLERLLDAAGLRVISYPAPQTFLNVAAGLPAGCVLIELRMPEMNALAVQSELARINPGLPIIMMSGRGDVASAVRAIKAGAADVLEKPFIAGVLLSAIERTLANWRPPDQVPPEVADAARRLETLSAREHEVLEALVAGRPNKVIAFDLGLSVRTVEVHRARMMGRLGVRQLSEAVRIAIMARLAPHGAARI